MFSLTIAVGNTAWAFLYKEKEVAEGAFATIRKHYFGPDEFGRKDDLYLQDDFGQQAVISRGSFHGFILEDLSVSKGAHIERALQQARTHAEAQTAWQNDPVARAAARGPSVLAPGMHMPNGRFSQ